MSKLGKYVHVYGQPFGLSEKNGKGIIEVQFHDGYVTVHSVQPGSQHFVQDIHITRSAWIKLLMRGLIKTTKIMEGPDFDRYRAERVYARQEQAHLADLREMKRERKRGRRRQRS